MRTCNTCNIQKDDSLFEKGRKKCRACKNKTGYAKRKDYFKSYFKTYLTDEKKADRKEKRKVYDAENKDKIDARVKVWVDKNRTTLNKKRSERKKKNPQIKIKDRLRLQIWGALKGKKKVAKTEELLGCSVEFFMNYMAEKFRDGMTWENYGYEFWHIDHIVALYHFDLTKEEHQRKAFHYTNLQPLLAKENLVKNKFVDPNKVKEYLAA